MASVQMLLFNALSDLLEEEFKNFKWQLTDGVAKGFSPIARNKLEKANQMDIVDLMVSQYGVSEVGKISVIVFQRIQKNKLAENLEKDLKEVQIETAGDGGSSASSALAPSASTVSQNISSAPAPGPSGVKQNISAGTGGKVSAPVVTGATFNETVNFTFN